MVEDFKPFRIIQGDTGGYGAPSYKCTPDGEQIEEWGDTVEVVEAWEAQAAVNRLRIESEKSSKALHTALYQLWLARAGIAMLMHEKTQRQGHPIGEQIRWADYEKRCRKLARRQRCSQGDKA